MTVRELRFLLRGLPPEMTVALAIEDLIFDVCQDSGEDEIEDLDTKEKENVFLIYPCLHIEEIEKPVEIPKNFNLN